jgi:hypothetical protein
LTVEQSQISRFLHALDDELQKLVADGRRLNLYLIGRSAMIVRYGLTLATKDIDIVGGLGPPELEKMALELFGEGTPNALRLGLYLEAVPNAVPPIPGTYTKRARPITGEWKVLVPWEPDPHDLAATKLKRFHAGDREDLQIMCDNGDLTVGGLEAALTSAFLWHADPEEDSDHARALANLRRVIDYLNGKSRSL